MRHLLPILSFASLLLVAPSLAQADSVPATVAYVAGDATYINPAGKKEKVTEGMQIPSGSAVSTGANSSVGLKLVPGATTVLGSNTDMKVSSLDYTQTATGEKKRNVLLGLSKGTIFSSLVKNDGKSSFRISTPKGVAAARGTDWSVTVTLTNVTVGVLDGVVQITLPNGAGVINVPTKKAAVSTTGTDGHLTYLVSDLDPKEAQAIIDAITAAGFQLSIVGVSYAAPYTDVDHGTYNPANISKDNVPTQSPNQ